MNGPTQPTPQQFPDLMEFEVETPDGDIVLIEGHNVQVQDGCLLIYRGVFIGPDCMQPGAVPASFFGAGDGVRCHTRYQGHTRKSELSLN